MKAKIVRIGNSKGIRIPKSFLQQCNFVEEVELMVKDGKLVIQQPAKPRAGWEEAFQKMSEEGDDRLDRKDLSATSWEDAEWEW